MRIYFSVLALVILAASTIACSMVDTYRITNSASVGPQTQHGGSYFLPKHLLRVTVKVDDKKKRTVTVASDIVADRNALAQVGFNLSPLSDDDIKVEYEKNGLLKGVAATATDRTGDILVQLAKTVAGFRATPEEQAAAVAIYEFDPFDWGDAAFVNSKLMARFQVCVEVEVRSGVWSPGCGTNSRGIAYKAEETDLRTVPPRLPGVYYRRPIAHQVHVIEGGVSKQLVSVQFANAAPIFKIDIERTAFIQRKTILNFESGVPTLVQVVKPSEGLAIVQLPLTIAKAIISAPVDAISAHKEVQTAQADLLESEAKRVQAQQKLASLTGTATSAIDVRSAVDVGSFRSTAAGNPITVASCEQIGITDPQTCAAALGRRE
ncbi:hypothetical protein [uncultured Bradyrhizobium sp.]|uniref:hypothetical protein n=1 Tax=uncultured Bradyrhizobium sp. TaxID=199684 RepID=UPI0035CA01E7